MSRFAANYRLNENLDNVEHVANYEKTTMWPPTKSASRSWLPENHHLTHVDEILDNDELTLRSCIRTFSRCMLVVSYLAPFFTVQAQRGMAKTER